MLNHDSIVRRMQKQRISVLDMVMLLHLTLRGCKTLSVLLIFLYNAKPSFEIAKWMAKDMLWQNMKINKIIQKT